MSKLMDKIFNKADQTQASYMKAVEKKEADLLQLNLELSEKQTILKDLHKETLKGNISEDTFEAEADKVKMLQDKADSLKKDIQMIQEYKTEDTLAVITELEEARDKHFKEHAKELEDLKTSVLESKLAYLDALVQSRAKYIEIVAPERRLDSLKIKMGIKKNSYISGSHDALSMISVPNGGYENLRVEQKELYDALEYGNTPESLKRLIEKRKA